MKVLQYDYFYPLGVIYELFELINGNEGNDEDGCLKISEKNYYAFSSGKITSKNMKKKELDSFRIIFFGDSHT